MTTLINPVILETSKEKTYGANPEDPFLEGCLSIPKVYGPVPRHTWVRVHFNELRDGTFHEVEQTYYGFPARVVQHENDHIDGILFTDYSKEFNLPLFKNARGGKLKPLSEAEREKLFKTAA